MGKLIAIEPRSFPEYEAAVIQSGGELGPVDSETRGLIWTDYSNPQALNKLLIAHPQIDWVQLPFAGVDAFAKTLVLPHRFTSAKGSYREPVAEHALALSLALMRDLPTRVRATSWGKPFAVSLYDAEVLIYGGGGITQELVKLLSPFRSKITVVRKQAGIPIEGATVVATSELEPHLSNADLVIVTAALTDETRHIFDARAFAAMKPTAYFVNIARGPVVVTKDLVAALNSATIAGAGIDVTDPEPLPDGHPLWVAANVIITPHTADTRPMVVRLFSERISENTRRFLADEPLIGQVSKELGY